jgi:hypothetical protein
MSLENPLWGAPHIHGELLKLGFDVAHQDFGFKPSSRLEAVASTRMKRKAIANVQQSCSDSRANPTDGVFGTDRRAHWKKTFDQFGGDPLPYGLNEINRKVVAKLAKHFYDQKLIAREPDVQTLFLAGTEKFWAQKATRRTFTRRAACNVICSAGWRWRINQLGIDCFEAISPG